MIISIRGTSGSGKSTIARKVMGLYEERNPLYIDGRKQPILYTCRSQGVKPLTVLGHYETACGGCDTIHDFETVFSWVRTRHEMGQHVLFEGVLLYSEIPLTTMLALEGLPLLVIALDTPLEVCLEGVNSRRQRRGEMEPVDPKNTAGKHRGTVTSMHRLSDNGVPVVWADRDWAFDLIVSEFDIQHLCVPSMLL